MKQVKFWDYRSYRRYVYFGIRGGGLGEGGKTAKRSTQNAPFSRHTDEWAVQRKARGIQRICKYNKTTDYNWL